MRSNYQFSPYGAFELKSSYQKNMLIGNFSVMLLVLLIVLSSWIVSYFAEPPISIIGPCELVVSMPQISDHRIPLDPDKIRIINKKPVVQSFQGGIPAPKPDEHFLEVEEIVFEREDVPMDQNALDGIVVDEDPFSGDFGSINGAVSEKIVYPGETEFIPCEKVPEMYFYKQPEYPRLCKLAQIEGEVIIKVLIGKDGLVIKALVAKSSGTEALDEAALSAAKENKFTPALQNSHPIMLWVSYKVTFKID